MLEHEQRHSDLQADQIEPAVEREPQAGVERQQGAEAMPKAASFEQLTGQAEVASQTGQTGQADKAEQQPLTNHDALIEQLAHGMVAKELDDKDEEFLATNGYRALPIIRGAHEFVMRTFVPTQSGKAPVVAFRGTVPTKVQTLIADLDPTGIGMYQFNPNRALIEGQMRAAASHGKVVSSGHSLGGALAQIAAATFPDCVGSVVTFQAPGVSKEMAQKLVQHNEQNPDDAIESSHHRVKGDLVPLGGEALTPGMIHNHEMVGGSRLSRNPLAKHTAMPLAQEELAQGRELPIHGDQGMVRGGDVTTEQDNAEKTQMVELARTGLGHLVYGTGKLIRGVGDAVSSVFR